MLTSRGQPDFNIISLSGGGQGEVFVVANALKSFILKLDMIESIFLKHFVEDCGFLVEAERMGDWLLFIELGQRFIPFLSLRSAFGATPH